jgi:hypothetical protein
MSYYEMYTIIEALLVIFIMILQVYIIKKLLNNDPIVFV